MTSGVPPTVSRDHKRIPTDRNDQRASTILDLRGYVRRHFDEEV